jgi:hypothetical protein
MLMMARNPNQGHSPLVWIDGRRMIGLNSLCNIRYLTQKAGAERFEMDRLRFETSGLEIQLREGKDMP